MCTCTPPCRCRRCEFSPLPCRPLLARRQEQFSFCLQPGQQPGQPCFILEHDPTTALGKRRVRMCLMPAFASSMILLAMMASASEGHPMAARAMLLPKEWCDRHGTGPDGQPESYSTDFQCCMRSIPDLLAHSHRHDLANAVIAAPRVGS